MTPEQTGLILAQAAAYDRRTVSRADVEAWHMILADLEFEDCQRAVVAHYADGKGWLMPSDVRERALALRRARIAAAVLPPPDVDPDDPVAYREALAEQRRQVAAGTTERKAIGS